MLSSPVTLRVRTQITLSLQKTENRDLISLKIDKKRTCLIVIDLQKGVVDFQTQPYDTKTVVSNTARLAAAFRRNKMPVFLVRVDVSTGLWPQT